MLVGDIIYNKRDQRFGFVMDLPNTSGLLKVKHHKTTHTKIYYISVQELNTEADLHITLKYKRKMGQPLTDFEKDLIKKLKMKYYIAKL